MSKEIIMNPDILPTKEEWQLVCKMVKQQNELTDEEIMQVYKDALGIKLSTDMIIDFARAILQKASEK